MLRPLAEACQKLDRQQVEKSFDESADAILRLAELPRPMVDGNLADAKAARRGQHRNEAVQFAVQPHFAKHLARDNISCRNCGRAAVRRSAS